MLLPLDSLLFGTNPPAGMDWSVIGHFAMLMRKTSEPVDPPITVTRIDGAYPPQTWWVNTAGTTT